LYIHKDVSRILKGTDMWLLKNESKKYVEIEHRRLKKKFKIPKSSLLYAMRRFSGINVINVTKKADYIIVDDFPQIEEYLSLSFGQKIDKNFLKPWKKYVSNLTGNLLLANHVNVSAPRTTILAYYSSQPIVVPRSMWSIRLPDEPAKILALWLNSSLGLLQMLMLRRETEGAYLWFVASTLRKFLIPNLDVLSKEDFKRLLEIFEEKSKIEFPSLLDQLKNKFSAKIEIDRTFLRIFGFNKNEIEEILAFLYPALANEIEQLKALMKG